MVEARQGAKSGELREARATTDAIHYLERLSSCGHGKRPLEARHWRSHTHGLGHYAGLFARGTAMRLVGCQMPGHSLRRATSKNACVLLVVGCMCTILSMHEQATGFTKPSYPGRARLGQIGWLVRTAPYLPNLFHLDTGHFRIHIPVRPELGGLEGPPTLSLRPNWPGFHTLFRADTSGFVPPRRPLFGTADCRP